MAEMRERLETPMLVGVGAAFDFHAGLVAQAPQWMQKVGLEWTYRLAREPRRLWRRYARYNPRFVLGFARQYGRHLRR
jgi:N-acetylglucosaminyldiphosphoundecaprenol N-acetyl-beta-D-mannosaminyltransferase